MQWYYALDEQRIGPVPHVELERLIQNRTLNGEALVWRQGMDQWKTLAEVQKRDPALFAQVAPSDAPSVEAKEDNVSEESLENDSTDRPEAAHRETIQASGAGRTVTPETMNYAGFFQRTGAFFLDAIFYYAGLQIFLHLFVSKHVPAIVRLNEKILASGNRWTYQATPEELIFLIKYTVLILFIAVTWGLVYDLFFSLKFGSTPGKLIFGLRVVDVAGQPLGFGRLLARHVSRWFVAFTLGIGYLIVAFDEQKRGLHDFFCSTRVIKKRDL